MNLTPIPDHEYIAYIDESGDPSIKSVRPIDDKGGTEWFVVSCILVRRDNDKLTKHWFSNVASKCGHPGSRVVKFTSLKHDQKLASCQEIAQLPLRVFAVTSNKKNMRGYRNKRAEKMGAKQWFYNWMVRILVERVTNYCWRHSQKNSLRRHHVKFVFSEAGGHSYEQTAAYHEILRLQSRSDKMVLQKWKPIPEVMHWQLVDKQPHYKLAGLQLADHIAGAFYQAVDCLDTGPCEPTYAMALKDRVAVNTDGSRKDFGLVLQPSKYWEADLSRDQQKVFQHYGYEFGRSW